MLGFWRCIKWLWKMIVKNDCLFFLQKLDAYSAGESVEPDVEDLAWAAELWTQGCTVCWPAWLLCTKDSSFWKEGKIIIDVLFTLIRLFLLLYLFVWILKYSRHARCCYKMDCLFMLLDWENLKTFQFMYYRVFFSTWPECTLTHGGWWVMYDFKMFRANFLVYVD